MTISHPANVNNILASGVDWLTISIDMVWDKPVNGDKPIFQYLDEIKEEAKKYGVDYQGQIKHVMPDEVWPFTIKPHGTKGFSWILTGCDFTFTIANSERPGSRPNVMIEFRAEALWRLGPQEVIKIALGILKKNGGRVDKAKLSRVDLCVDFLLPEKIWSYELLTYSVTRAADATLHFHHMKLTGITIGKGYISARLYDKPREIQKLSKKMWMYDIWKIYEIPAGKKIIRIEFELRREVLKELGLKEPNDLLQKSAEAWAYCTKDWLKFQDRPGLHHTQRSTFKWYEEIQNGFKGIQGAEPLVREKAIRSDEKRLMQQANGILMSLHASKQEKNNEDRDKPVKIEDCIRSYVHEVRKHPLAPSEIQEKVIRKRSKFHREKPSIDGSDRTMRHRGAEE